MRNSIKHLIEILLILVALMFLGQYAFKSSVNISRDY